MKAIELGTLIVTCDTDGCGFECDTDDLSKWHNVKCPKCGQGVLITDEDIRTFNSFIGVVDMLNTANPNPDPNSVYVDAVFRSKTQELEILNVKESEE